MNGQYSLYLASYKNNLVSRKFFEKEIFILMIFKTEYKFTNQNLICHFEVFICF